MFTQENFVLENTMLLEYFACSIFDLKNMYVIVFGITAIVIIPKESLNLVFGLHAFMRSNPRNNALRSISFLEKIGSC